MNASNGTCVEFFGAQANRWEKLYQTRATFRDRLGLFSRMLKEMLPRPGRLLDYGCGPGVMSIHFAKIGYSVVGVDGAAKMIEQAEALRRRHRIGNARFCVMDARRPGIAGERFDGIVCSSVIEYLENDRQVLRDLAGILRPGGVLLVSVPQSASVIGRMEDALGQFSAFAGPPGRRHMQYSRRRYAAGELESTLRALGFEPLKRAFFEVPALGSIGVPFSRIGLLGVMLLVAARKEKREIRRPLPAGSDPSPLVARVHALSRKNLWEGMPPLSRRVIGWAAARMDRKYILGRRFRRALSFVRSAERLPLEQSRAIQLDELRRICELACQKTGYYRRSLGDTGFVPGELKSIDDFARLPLIDRNVVRERLSEMTVRPFPAHRADQVSTAGTSGTPLHFYIGDERSSVEYAYLTTSWRRIGYRLGTPLAVFRGRVVSEDRQGLRHEYDPLLEHHYYSALHMDDDNLRRCVQHVAALGPCFLHVYPSSVFRLARFIRSKGLPVPGNIRGIIAESEIVYPEQRAFVEEVFGCRYLACYGQTEKLVLATECEESADYHVWPTYGYFELLDEAGRPIDTPGRRGEIVGTSFINNVVPFIRYRTGDYATYVGDRCEACGRWHTVIRDIRGHRVQEFLLAADGSEIPWVGLNMHDDTFLNVRQFQFVQQKLGHAVLQVVPEKGFGDADARRIASRLQRKLEGRLSFVVRPVDTIPLSPSGKAIYVNRAVEGK